MTIPISSVVMKHINIATNIRLITIKVAELVKAILTLTTAIATRDMSGFVKNGFS